MNATATWHIELICTLPSLLGLRQPKPLSNFQQPSLKKKKNLQPREMSGFVCIFFLPAQRYNFLVCSKPYTELGAVQVWSKRSRFLRQCVLPCGARHPTARRQAACSVLPKFSLPQKTAASKNRRNSLVLFLTAPGAAVTYWSFAGLCGICVGV